MDFTAEIAEIAEIMRGQERDCVVVLDIGTTALKCGSVDAAGSLVCSALARFELSQHSSTARLSSPKPSLACPAVDGLRSTGSRPEPADGRTRTCRAEPVEGHGKVCETDFAHLGDAALNLLGDVIASSRREGCEVAAILITSQAQTFVPVDAEFNPLSMGLVWLDARAEEEAAYLAERLADFPATAGTNRPMPEHYVSKLLWLRNHERGLYERAAFFPIVHEYVAQRLTGRFYSEFGNFGMGGLLDIRTREPNRRALKIVGLAPDRLPELGAAAVLSHDLTPAVCARFGLGRAVPVYFCGNDQSASAVGAGVRKAGDVSANFGTALVLYTLSDTLPDRILPGQIAGVSPLREPYFLLGVENEVGNVIETAKNRYFAERSYDDFFRTYEQSEAKPRTCSDQLACSLVRHCLERFLFHLSQLGNVAGAKTVYVSGGMTRSAVWLDILRRNCDREIVCVNQQEAGIVGAARIYAMRRGAG